MKFYFKVFSKKNRTMNTDISVMINEQRFNFRVSAIIINEGKILVMHDGKSPYGYLPGGRVQIGEDAETALIREMQEELHVKPKIIRPLWLNQSFFTEDASSTRFHEICIYYLVDIKETDILCRGEEFTCKEKTDLNYFKWIDFKTLQDEYFYPVFLQSKIFTPPDSLTLITERE